MRHTILLTLLAGLLAGGPITAAEPLPYGHPDFVPTPERPIGFQGDGNGHFPGATMVSEFWDGRPVWGEVELRDEKGSLGTDNLSCRQRHPKEKENRCYTDVLCRTLTGTAQQEFLISALRVNDSNNQYAEGERQDIIRTLISLGKKAEPILPELERFIAERPVMGLKLAPALTAIVGEERMRSILTKAGVTPP